MKNEKRIKVSVTRTIQTAPYENFKIEIAQEEDVLDDVDKARKRLFADIYKFVDEVEDQLRKIYIKGEKYND